MRRRGRTSAEALQSTSMLVSVRWHRPKPHSRLPQSREILQDMPIQGWFASVSRVRRLVGYEPYRLDPPELVHLPSKCRVREGPLHGTASHDQSLQVGLRSYILSTPAHMAANDVILRPTWQIMYCHKIKFTTLLEISLGIISGSSVHRLSSNVPFFRRRHR